MEITQMIIAIIITIPIIPTAAPALKIPAMAEQLLSKVTIISMAARLMYLFISFNLLRFSARTVN